MGLFRLKKRYTKILCIVFVACVTAFPVNASMTEIYVYVDENGMLTDTPPDPASKKKTKVEDIEISIPKKDPNDRPDPIRRGRLTFYNDSKGYGFIRDAETQESVFVHVNEFQDDIMEGNMVSFEVEKGHKGPAAVRVKLA